MRLLHAIRDRHRSVWYWGALFGRNSRALSRVPGRTNQQYAHLWLMERQAPQMPPLPTTERPLYGSALYTAWSHRAYFNPWTQGRMARAEILTPLCGPVQTRSDHPSISEVSRYQFTYETVVQCPACLAAANRAGITPQLIDQVRASDPWFAISINTRPSTPDPVTGQ